ncbi:unnamed protein product, partial [Timema podura]|nr:unnamed protein product [Timema podura]
FVASSSTTIESYLLITRSLARYLLITRSLARLSVWPNPNTGSKGGPRKSSPPPISSRRLTLNWRRSIPFHPYCDMKNEKVNCFSKAQYGVEGIDLLQFRVSKYLKFGTALTHFSGRMVKGAIITVDCIAYDGKIEGKLRAIMIYHTVGYGQAGRASDPSDALEVIIGSDFQERALEPEKSSLQALGAIILCCSIEC